MKIEFLWQFIVVFVILQTRSGRSENNGLSELNETFFENERLFYAARMNSYMDHTTDPCKDFHQYACGNFFNINKEKGKSGRFGLIWAMIDELNDKIHDMLMNSSNLELDVYNKAGIFYQSCLKADLYPYKKSEVYLNLIQSLGGWPVLDNSWKEESFDWLLLTCKLNSYGVSTIIKEDSFDGFSYLYPKEFGFFPMGDFLYRPFSREFQKNKEYAVYIMKLYGVPEIKAVKTFEEMVEFGKVLEDLRNKSQSIEDAESEDICLTDFFQSVPQINWTTFYSDICRGNAPSNISISDSTKEFLKGLPEIFQGNNIRRAANYFILLLLFNLHDEFQAEKDQKVFCVKQTKKFMGPVVSAMFLESNNYDQNAADDLLAMSIYIRMAFRDIIKSSKWLDSKSIKGGIRKIDEVNVYIGDSGFNFSKQNLTELYSKFNPTLEKPFQSNVLEAMQITAKHGILSDFGYDIEVNANFGGNELIVLPGIFLRPIYYPELPKSYNFGAIGALLGHEFSHLVDGRQLHEEWWNEESTNEFKLRRKCIIDQYSNYRMDVLSQTINAKLNIPDDLADYGGIRNGYFGYKKWLRANRGNIDMNKLELPGLNMTHIQLFFLSFAQMWCESVKGFRKYKEMSEDGHSPGKWRIIGTLSNFDEFSKAFNCKVGSGMNPENKCILW